MAGLQYYFFPTDFYYPKPPKPAATNLPPPQQVTPPVAAEPVKPAESAALVDRRNWGGNKIILRASAPAVTCYPVERKNNPRRFIDED
nr:metal tolerance protein 9-like [Ipomoea batatas]GME04267.1 metal tolerance protein 9-like [Ipomoea batatas]GME20796.1 metal tolerance protein 9-like [Ipomoea batatas]